MRYRDWLNLNLHLLWCHNLPVARGHEDAGKEVLRSTEYTNSAAWLVREGWAQVEHDGERHLAKPGQWLIVKPGKRVQTFSADARMISIAFEARWPDGSHLFDEGLSLVVDGEDAPQLELCVRPILNLVKEINPDSWDAREHVVDLGVFLTLEKLLCEWLEALAGTLQARGVRHSGHAGIDDRVRKVVDLLNAMVPGEALDVEKLATQVGLSTNHLVRLFRRDLRATPAQYRERLRVEYARHRLLQQESRVKEVALELGFVHLSHFSNWFKRHAGATPRGLQKG